jgi:enoyl-CoA hydratase
MANNIDYTQYKTLNITRRGANQTVLDIQMRADGPGGNGKLPTAGHEAHWELAEIWRDVSRDDSVRAAVLRGEGLGFSGGGDFALVEDMARTITTRISNINRIYVRFNLTNISSVVSRIKR